MPGKNIESTTLEELFSQDTDGHIPILLDIEHEDVCCDERSNGEQEDGHLRLINNSVPGRYEGKKYIPCYFSFEVPSEDGQKVGDTSITISAIDQRIIEIIRSIKSKPTATVIAAFAKINDTKIMFSKLYHYRFEMSNANWDGITAKWNLTFDPMMKQNVPVDKATAQRCPAAYDKG